MGSIEASVDSGALGSTSHSWPDTRHTTPVPMTPTCCDAAAMAEQASLVIFARDIAETMVSSCA